jgi:methylenetetrahydrofolate--tRNA-(uracil-5-)-methyltransferase
MENKAGTMYSMVGFQTKMKWPEQKRVFSMIPALAKAEFVRFGSVHRNTYVQSPKVLSGDLSFRANERIFLAGQVTGVEGYSESAAIGLLAGRAAAARIKNVPIRMPPKSTIIGALCDYVTVGPLGPFQPMNANLGLLPPMERRRGQSKADKKAAQATAARNEFAAWMDV